jgi:hypothetical protein
MRLQLSTTACLLLLLVQFNHSAMAQAEVDFKKMADLVVQVVDDQQKPVEGARVYAYAMRGAEGGGHGYWNDALIGPPKTVVSDANGKAVIQYPVHIGSATEPMTTSEVSFQVQHSDFVQQVVHFRIGPASAEVTMKPGCEVQLSAVDPDGNPVPDFAVMMAGPLAPSFWADDGKGGRRTRAASDGSWQTMIVKPQDDGTALFSGVLPLRVRPDQDVKIRNVKLLPGTKIVGTLSDSVPRPVKNGYIIAVSAPKPAENSYADKDPSITWHDWSEIKEDGTFTLASIPRGGDLQVIGICDGWLSATTIPEANNHFIMGQLFQLDKDEPQIELTLEMERTGSLELTVLQPDGSPLNAGEIASWPNQLYLKGGSTLLGQRYRSIQFVELQLTPPEQRARPRRESMQLPYQGKVVNGKVILSGLPIGRTESLALLHPHLILKSENAEGEVPFKLDSPDPKPMTLNTTLPKAAATEKE